MFMLFNSFTHVDIFAFIENKRITCFCLLLTYLSFALQVQGYSPSYDGMIEVGMYVWVVMKS